ncbi:MAG: NRDE family protein [Planctomycetota bacterium]
MCTVSLLSLSDHGSAPPSGPAPGTRPVPAGAFRLVTNRDEQHHRPAALHPLHRTFGPRTALMPVDPVSDGTWVAVNDAGLALTLLNYKRPELPPVARPPSVSRGRVIPDLLHHATVRDAADALADFDPGSTPPFRLLLVDASHQAVVRADGRRLVTDLQPRRAEPLLLTSSGLGDHLVEPPREALFRAAAPATAADQNAFHRHQWPDRTPVSVQMHRPDARTISRTAVTVRPGRITLAYTPIGFDGAQGPTTSLSLSPLPDPAEAAV